MSPMLFSFLVESPQATQDSCKCTLSIFLQTPSDRTNLYDCERMGLKVIPLNCIAHLYCAYRIATLVTQSFKMATVGVALAPSREIKKVFF